MAISVDDRPALPLFTSADKALRFLESTGFEVNVQQVSVSGLLGVLEGLRNKVRYVAIDPPPASEGGMRVEMGRLAELARAIEQSLQEDDPLGLWRN